MRAIPVYDPSSPEFRQDPHDQFRALRTHAPIHRSMDFWVLTRYADVAYALRDRRFERGWPRRLEATGLTEFTADSPALQMEHLFLLHQDPPDHTRLRTLVNKAFTPRVVASLRPRIQAVTHDLLDRLDTSREVDLVSEFALQLPVTVITDLLGVRISDLDQLAAWSGDIMHTMQYQVSEDLVRTADEAARQFVEFFGAEIEDHRAHPRDDLLTRLVEAEADGHRLNEPELLAMCVQLCIAGFETTTSAIGSGMLTLLQWPSELEHLRADLDLTPAAATEILRYEPPVIATSRRVTEDTQIGDVTLRANDMLLASMAAANRDPEQFDDPDTFRIDRPGSRPMAFGAGIHFCLGAQLAQIEIEVAIESLLRKFPVIELAEEPIVWRDLQNFRSLERLPLRLSRTAP